MINAADYNRIRWASRRGMLELDLMLVPFVENCFMGLDDKNKQRYISLLDGEDNDLFAWCLGRKIPDDLELAAIIKQIIDYSHQCA